MKEEAMYNEAAPTVMATRIIIATGGLCSPSLFIFIYSPIEEGNL